jgi:hypothetical protein
VLAEGMASAEDIDAGMKLGCNQPIGPLALADMIGLDVCLAVMEVYLEEFGDSKYRACPLLKKWSPPATWAARPAAASTPTERPPARPGSPRVGLSRRRSPARRLPSMA